MWESRSGKESRESQDVLLCIFLAGFTRPVHGVRANVVNSSNLCHTVFFDETLSGWLNGWCVFACLEVKISPISTYLFSVLLDKSYCPGKNNNDNKLSSKMWFESHYVAKFIQPSWSRKGGGYLGLSPGFPSAADANFLPGTWTRVKVSFSESQEGQPTDTLKKSYRHSTHLPLRGSELKSALNYQYSE